MQEDDNATREETIQEQIGKKIQACIEKVKEMSEDDDSNFVEGNIEFEISVFADVGKDEAHLPIDEVSFYRCLTAASKEFGPPVHSSSTTWTVSPGERIVKDE